MKLQAMCGPLAMVLDRTPARCTQAHRAVCSLPPAGKPAAIVDKMVEGRLQKYYQEVCLLEQPFIMDDTKRVSVGRRDGRRVPTGSAARAGRPGGTRGHRARSMHAVSALVADRAQRWASLALPPMRPCTGA